MGDLTHTQATFLTLLKLNSPPWFHGRFFQLSLFCKCCTFSWFVQCFYSMLDEFYQIYLHNKVPFFLLIYKLPIAYIFFFLFILFYIVKWTLFHKFRFFFPPGRRSSPMTNLQWCCSPLDTSTGVTNELMAGRPCALWPDPMVAWTHKCPHLRSIHSEFVLHENPHPSSEMLWQ